MEAPLSESARRGHVSRPRSRISGFSLIELLVVVAIAVVLIALLLAAAQKVREAANRLACANNLRQIALAAHHYHDLYGALPPNYAEDLSRTDGSHNLFYGPMVRLLPFLEQEQTYKNFSFLYYDSPFPDPMGLGWPNVSGGMTWANHSWTRNPFNRPPVSTLGLVPPPDPMSCPNPSGATNVPGQTWGGEGNFQAFRCASQPFDHSSVNQGSVITSFFSGLPTIDMPRGNPFSDPALGHPECADTNTSGVGCDIVATSYPPGGYILGRSDYVAVVGAFTDSGFTKLQLTPDFAKKYKGLFNYTVTVGLSNVSDGTSNTLLFSEYSGRMATNQPLAQLNGWIAGGWAMNGISSVYGACPDPNNSSDLGGYCFYKNDLGGGLTLGGWHQGRFNVAFADGSVRLVRTDIDRMLLLSLTGYNDGDVVPPDF
jgi:prepilin-type processing-associated H-X9-DG protein/prepilin-type N-terminal cleavage/methylation domain-containing protein